jgi:hypothetical protein
MAYIPVWESMAEALARVTAHGCSMADAQCDICRALRDGMLRARYRVERVQTPYGFEVSRGAFGLPRGRLDQEDLIGRPCVPPDLSPDDIDWVNSRPKSPWLDKRRFLVGIARIEILTAHVIRVLCGGAKRVSTSDPRAEEPLAKKVLEEPITTAAEEPVFEQPLTTTAKGRRPTAADEGRAAKALEAQLRLDHSMSVAGAKKLCSEIGPALGNRPFGRVWRKARVAAGLDRTAKAGRKRKSPR